MATPETAPTIQLQQCNPHIASYATYLREVYRYRSQSHTSQHWTHLPRCEFIQLAMIKGGKLRRGGPEEEMVRLAQQGRIETIMSHKTTINLNSLLVTEQPLVVLPPPPHARVVLIEGAPGGGKSTLAFYFCHQWAQSASFLSRFDIVVIAYLRDQAIQNASTLADILPADSFEMSQMVATQIKHCHGHNVLFIFDGWDEFPHRLQSNSLVSTIIRNAEKLSLHRSTVLITSRPVSSGNLFIFVNRRVEILGFTQHQIREYIEEALDGNSAHVQKLVQHLEDHPVIEGYCYIPLHAAILVHVFLTKNGVLPTTHHQLFSHFILCCIVRELETRDSKQTVPELSSLDNLPTDLQTKLSYLCVLAYEGVIRDKVVFYREDLEAFNLPASLPSLGLLQAVEGLTLFSKSLSYNFLHLSVQELLAAYHISLMNPDEQLDIFQNLVESPRFQSVLQYYSGFTKLANQGIQSFISSYTRQKSNFDGILPLLHCFFEAQQRSLCLLVDSKFRSITLDKYLNPVAFLVIGYFITSVTSKRSAAAHLEIDSINDHQAKLLLSELPILKYPVKVLLAAGALPLKLGVNEFSKESSSYIATSFPEKSPLITELLVKVGHFQKVGLTSFVKAMRTRSYLTRLQLPNINLECTKKDGDALIEMLQWNKSLTHLDLSSNKTFPDTEAHGFFKVLQCNTTLIHLDLYKTGITDTEAVYIAQFLITNHSIQTLDISGNHIGEYGFACIAKSLKLNLTIKRLYITYAGNVERVVKVVNQERRDKKLDPFKLFNDYSKEVELSAEELQKVRNTDHTLSMKSSPVNASPTSLLSSLSEYMELSL